MPNQSGITKEKRQRCMKQSQNERANLKQNSQIQSKVVNMCFESSKKCFAERFTKINTGLWKNSALIDQFFSAKPRFMFQKFNHLYEVHQVQFCCSYVRQTAYILISVFLECNLFYRYYSIKCPIQSQLTSVARFPQTSIRPGETGGLRDGIK